MFSYLYINSMFIEFIYYYKILYTILLVFNVDFKINNLFLKCMLQNMLFKLFLN